MRVSLIAALGENNVIGREGDLPWRLSDDLKWFKKVTMGKPVIMGRKTYHSIGKALPGRTNIVITRRTDYAVPDAETVDTIEMALEAARSAARASNIDEIFVIGGAEIYKSMFHYADRLYLTRVKASPDGDAFFPEVEAEKWKTRIEGTIEKGPKNDYDAECMVMDRL